MQLYVKAKLKARVKARWQGVYRPSLIIEWQSLSWADLSHISSDSSPARLLCCCFAGTKGTALQRASCLKTCLKTETSQEEDSSPTLPSAQAGKAGLLVKAGTFAGANWCFEQRPRGVARQPLLGATCHGQRCRCSRLPPSTCIIPLHH